MKKKVLSVLLAGIMAFAMAACGSSGSGSSASSDSSGSDSSSSSSGDTIIIGSITPNTGGFATAGLACVNGMDLAVEEINAAGGINGKQVEMKHMDDQMDSTECLNAFNSLVADGVSCIVGSLASSNTSAITDAANEEETVLITPASTADSITTEDDYVFRACYADSFQGAIAAAYAKQQGYTDVGVVYCAADTYSKGLYDSFKTACEKYGINIAAEESVATMDVQDYTNQFTSMVNAGVEFVYAPFYYDSVGPYVIPQARAAGYTGIIMGEDGYDGTQGYVAEGTDLSVYNNVLWTNHFDPSGTEGKVPAFTKAYQDKFGEDPISYAALGYDCIYMLKQAMEKAGSEEASAVRDALADTSEVYDCVTGKFSLDETGTPVKGAVIIEFYADGDKISTKLKDTVDELPDS